MRRQFTVEELRERLQHAWDRLAEAMNLDEAIRLIRAQRRLELVEMLKEAGWSEQAAEEHLQTRSGVVATYQEKVITKRESQNKPLANRLSGRRRREPAPRRTPWWTR